MSLGTPTQLRHLFDVVSGSTPESGNAAYWDGEIPWVTPEDVSQVEGNVLRETRRRLTAEGFANSGATMVAAGGIVLTKRAPIGQLALLGLCACSNQGCFLLSAREGIEPRFFYYVLANSVPLLQALGRGSTFMELSTDDLKALRVPFLQRSQQLAIADFLDRETVRLDALVAAKQRLLDLLAEKRKAVIATAVTRGLDPKVKLRDSGVPWLGEIPAHWELWKVGHVAKVGNGSTPERDKGAYWSEGSFPWLNSSVVNQEEVTSSDQFVTDAALRECHLPRLRPGTVLVAITGQGKTRGQAVVLSIEATINQHMAFVAPDPALVDAWFLRWSFYRAYDYLRSISDDAGGTKGALTCEDVAGLRIPIPPPDEQRTIVEHIARETAQLDAVRAATERTIALLKERRAALIAAAVTGLVDVGTAA